MKDIWRKFYQCDCGAEGIMMSTEDLASDKTRQIYLAFFNNIDKYTDCRLNWKQQLRWIWQIIIHKMPFTDTVLLNTHTARKLGNDLIKFADGKLK